MQNAPTNYPIKIIRIEVYVTRLQDWGKARTLLEKGKKFKTNASLDRINAGGPYTKDNVQLVCSALNSWRSDTDLNEFIWWCSQVTQHQEKEGR